MLARRLTPLVAAGVLAGLAATGCAGRGYAIRVGDNTYSEADLIEELDAYGQNEALLASNGQSPENFAGELGDSYSQSFVSQVVNQRITFMVAEEVFDQNDLELTDADTSAAEGQLGAQIRGFEHFPADYRERFIADVARYNVVGRTLGGEGLQAAMTEVAKTTDIEVSPRFGQWDQDQLLSVPPAGPAPAPGSGPSSALGDQPSGASAG